MTRTLEIDEGRLEAARRLTGEQKDRAAVERILRAATDARKKNAALLDLVGKVDFYQGFDPKALGPVRNDLVDASVLVTAMRDRTGSHAAR